MSGVCITCQGITAGKGLRCKSCAKKGNRHPLHGQHRTAETKSKLRDANLGKKMTESNKLALKKANLGNKHAAGTNNASYIDGRYIKSKLWRNAVRERDNFTCQVCGKTKEEMPNKIDCHHIKNKKDYPELQYKVNNGILLCKCCHPVYENKPKLLEIARTIYVRKCM